VSSIFVLHYGYVYYILWLYSELDWSVRLRLALFTSLNLANANPLFWWGTVKALRKGGIP
jgi:hypothetical protein